MLPYVYATMHCWPLLVFNESILSIKKIKIKKLAIWMQGGIY